MQEEYAQWQWSDLNYFGFTKSLVFTMKSQRESLDYCSFCVASALHKEGEHILLCSGENQFTLVFYVLSYKIIIILISGDTTSWQLTSINFYSLGSLKVDQPSSTLPKPPCSNIATHGSSKLPLTEEAYHLTTEETQAN